MKHLLIILFSFMISTLFGQNFSYNNSWKQIDKALDEGRYKSLESSLQSIYRQAQREGEHRQKIKALLYLSGLAWDTEEEDVSEGKSPVLSVFERFRDEVDTTEGVEKALLQCYLAQMYLRYAESTSSDRTDVTPSEEEGDDCRAWSNERFHREVVTIYDSLMLQGELLQSVKVDDYRLLMTDKGSNLLQPTLFDMVVHYYIRYLKNPLVVKRSDKEQKAQIVELYKRLIDFHAQDTDRTAFLFNRAALITVENENDPSEMNKQLEALADASLSAPYTAAILAQIVQNIKSPLGFEFSSPETVDLVRIHALCTKALDKVPASHWNIPCKNELNRLNEVEVKVRIPQINIPDQPIPMWLSHQNIDYVDYEVYPMKVGVVLDKELSIKGNYVDDFIFGRQEDSKKPPYRKERVQLHPFSDYQKHSTCYKIDALPKGVYQLRTSMDGKDGKNTNNSCFAVTSMAYVAQPRSEGGAPQKTLSVQFINIETGEAIARQPFHLIKERKVEKKGVTSWYLSKKDSTDAFGCSTFALESGSAEEFEALAYFPTLDEWIYLKGGSMEGGSFYHYDEYDETKGVVKRVQFLTDRTLYRPNQTVHFKGILTQSNRAEGKAVLLKNHKVTVLLQNEYYKTVSEINLVSNEYGSFSGSFITPSSGLTGSYVLSCKGDVGGHYTLRVEEYKRPKFEVLLTTPVGDYLLGSFLEVKGEAAAFTGMPIVEGKVVYRVERRQQNFWRGCFFSYPYQEERVMIDQGTLLTDAKGLFTIPFTAEAPEKAAPNDYRSYIYLITADVTDVNGETQSQTARVVLGDLPKYLRLGMDDMLYDDLPLAVKLSSFNLKGEKTPSKGELRVTQLRSPERVLLPNRSSLSTVDYQLYDYDRFVSFFPHLIYRGDELNPEQFKRERLLLKQEFDTEKEEAVQLTQKLDKGYYLIEAFTLSGADTISTEQVITVRDRQTQSGDDRLFFAVTPDKASYDVGEEAVIQFRSGFNTGTVYVRVERNNQLGALQEVKLQEGVGQFTLKLTERELLYGIFVHAAFVHLGDYKVTRTTLDVKRKTAENQRLQITTTVFRDKITPGAEEQWLFKVSGVGKDSLLAEVIATMYDASLDMHSKNSFSDVALDRGTTNRNIYSRWYNHQSRYEWLNRTSYDYLKSNISKYISEKDVAIPYLNWFFFYPEKLRYSMQSMTRASVKSRHALKRSAVADEEASYAKEEMVVVEDAAMVMSAGEPQEEAAADNTLSEVAVRRNLQETAFFYPQLYTDKAGDLSIAFRSPEALTRWKLLLFAHNQALGWGDATFFTQTVKELMVVPNAPRFVREGDTVVISSKVSNLSNKRLSGEVELMLFDALDHRPVDGLFANHQARQTFQVEESGDAVVHWVLHVPQELTAVVYRVVAKAGDFSDGEEQIMPILPNRQLVTETMPLHVKEGQTKRFKMERLQHPSSTMQHVNLTMELTTDPTWLAIFSLPYLREYPYDCSEQVFSRYYANLISQYILHASPKIRRVFDEWNAKEIPLSNLEKSPELKSILLEESPWVRDAESETEQMRRLALLFDLNNMTNERQVTFEKLSKKQMADGGFPWFEGGRSSRTISLHLIGGFGKLQRMLKDQASDYLQEEQHALIARAIQFVDKSVVEEVNRRKKEKEKVSGNDYLSYYYHRSFWVDRYPLPQTMGSYLQDVNKKIDRYFASHSLQHEVMAAIVLSRYGYKTSATRILRHLKESSVESDEMGMYWKRNVAGWAWEQAPIETQALIIEAFTEIDPQDVASVEEMKVWLLKQRQTNSWPSTKATAEAVYALMHLGKDWSDSAEGLTVTVGRDTVFPPRSHEADQQSGYLKQSWKGEEITPDKGEVTLSKQSPGVAWGGLYWQYFEELDKITSASSDVRMEKQLFIKENQPTGVRLAPLVEAKVGDLITVRLVITTDRDMEYIHIKDMRAAGFEPTTVLSGYKWQNGVGYYESTRDASTNFFIDYLPKGVYVFEYDLRANSAGKFSNGFTSFQSMYAPEMSAHSPGRRVTIRPLIKEND